jgi:hypothetical protein
MLLADAAMNWREYFLGPLKFREFPALHLSPERNAGTAGVSTKQIQAAPPRFALGVFAMPELASSPGLKTFSLSLSPILRSSYKFHFLG